MSIFDFFSKKKQRDNSKESYQKPATPAKLPPMYKVWSCAFDGYDCLDCLRMEGKAVPENRRFTLNGKPISGPPLHKECRCGLEYSEKEFLEPQLNRDIEKLKRLADLVNTSCVVAGVENGYIVLMELLEELSLKPESELKAAGFSISMSLHDYSNYVRVHKDKIIDQAIERAVDQEIKNAADLKTERGKRNRLLRLREEILECKTLSPHNLDYLSQLIPAVDDAERLPNKTIHSTTIDRNFEIVQDCKELVYNSTSISIVESRYRLLVKKLRELSSFDDLAEIEANKITVFNQAIDRSCAKALEHAKTLKTPKGREQAIQRKQTDDLNVLVSKGLPNECINHLYQAYSEAMSMVKAL